MRATFRSIYAAETTSSSVRASVFLIALSGLVFEIGLTRIYSATIWYHYAFVVISVALLGWGLGGVATHLLKKKIVPSEGTAAFVSLLYAASIPASLWILVRYPFEIERLALYFVTPLVPFFLAGMVLSLIFDAHRSAARLLYFADLLGASLGALAVTALLQLLGGEGTLLVATLAPLGAAACLSRKIRTAAAAGAVVVALAAFSHARSGTFHVTPGTIKAMRRQMEANPGSRVTQSGWTAYSRIDGVEGIPPPYLARLYIDSDAWTSIYPWDGRLTSVPLVRDSFRALPFRLVPDAETLVIGPGGGSDVLAALVSGSRKVTAVEMNPLMIRFVRHYGVRAGNLYDRPDVQVIQSEGRSFISRTTSRFDIIFLGFVDSWASVASGGLSLTENYLYTTEAFRAYYEHLTERGILVILRWPFDIPRLVSNSVALLGADAARARIAVLTEKRNAPDDPSQMLFMLRKRPFTPAETAEIVEGWTRAIPLIVPGHQAAAPYEAVLSGRKSLAAYEAESARLVGPVADDKPFYFAVERPWGMPPTIASRLIKWLLAPSFGLLLIFAALGKPRGESVRHYAASVVYFVCLGYGFIAVELALLQQFTLLLGHPIFTLSVLLFTLLAAGGVGSALSMHVPVVAACLAAGILGASEAWGLQQVMGVLLPLPLGLRVAIAIGLIVPLGLVMGMPFPRGLQRAGRGALPGPAFFWGLNGIMSVIGSVITVFVAIQFGFQTAMLIGCGCYLVAALVSQPAFGSEPG